MNTTNINTPNEHPLRRRLFAALGLVSYVFFWFGVLLFAMGNFITFVPGGELDWFALTAALTATGFFIPKWHYRIGAAVFVTLSILIAFNGHKQGVKYRRHLDRRHASSLSAS